MGVQNRKISTLIQNMKGYVYSMEDMDGIYDSTHKTYMIDMCDTLADVAQQLKIALDNV